MVNRACGWKLEQRVGLVDLLEVGLDRTTGDHASKHGFLGLWQMRGVLQMTRNVGKR